MSENKTEITNIVECVRKAQEIYSTYSQKQVDKIFAAVAKKANMLRVEFAKMAVEETDMGLAEDKVIKNHYASEYIFNAYKNTKTCGIIEHDAAYGITKIASPIGVVAAIIPTTNPTSTAIFKILLCLKTRNGIILSPHPRAKKCTVQTAKILLETAIKAGAPQNIIGWLDEPSVDESAELMKQADMILATGGPGMVKVAYSSGKPAIGVGAGNTPAVILPSADIKSAVSSIILSKTFDNGVICASEQAVVAVKDIYEKVKTEFIARGGYFLNDEETQSVRKTLFKDNKLNAEIVGKTAVQIAKKADIDVPESTKVLVGEINVCDKTEPLAWEKLCPVIAMLKAENAESAFQKAEELVNEGGLGHTASIYLDAEKERELLNEFSERMKACRIVVNTPSSHGGIGDLYNFKLAPSLTLGCGSWGGNSVSENVGVIHLLNIKTVAERRENMLWFRTPEKIYLKRGCTSFALEEIVNVMGKKRAFVVTDDFLFSHGFTKNITGKLTELKAETAVFHSVEPDPALESAREGAKQMAAFKPDVIIAFGGGSAMDAAKIMWVLYEYPDTNFMDMAMRFQDIRKRVYGFPKMGEKAYFVAVPTSAGTGSEVTPFAVITDEKTGIKYPIADYELLPDMAIVDIDFHMSAPKSLTAASGIDALTHAIESYASMLATDFTDAAALHSIKLIFEYLPKVYENGNDIKAREKMANAATIAGMAFANSFLGVCHSMAHKLGAYCHLSHGVANALLICEIIRFNSAEIPAKMGTFPQYAYPMAKRRYAEIAEHIGICGGNDDDKMQQLINKIEQLKDKLEIKRTIKDYGIDEKHFLKIIDEMSEKAFDDQCTGANPRYPLISEIKEIYLKAYYG
ncbi:MAG: bifunctional acetaldehyde-CoA/alcohol dehydrogenase [Faecalibacterium sp.]|nr:bifunctional acetaldehyde-CoA/alcohol dehydrogenase [Ruminococcus sp.]MCM1391250.1 bifunctional acetaldehyde-CoA/alcohol dehydrogenase [Ruminococcus sp.]MCM1484776.1 bifunctional acetaldehyde-CoA/alcohol dehydrogenase [Faecalibacterium sp.]